MKTVYDLLRRPARSVSYDHVGEHQTHIGAMAAAGAPDPSIWRKDLAGDTRFALNGDDANWLIIARRTAETDADRVELGR